MAAAKRTPPRGDRVSMYWGQTAWNETDEKAAPAPDGASKGKRTGPNPSKPSRRVQRAAAVARKAAYREAMRDWVMGVPIDNIDALRAIALRVAHERPTGLSHAVGGMDRGLEAMERASGKEMPTKGPFMQSLIDAYHAGLNVWGKRKKAREEFAKVATKEGRLDERESNEARKGRMSATFHVTAPLVRRELHLRVYDLAESLIRRTFVSPATVRFTSYFRLYVAEQWHISKPGTTLPVRHEPTVQNPSSRGKNARANVIIDCNVLPLWRAGLAGFFGPRTLVLGICRHDPATCVVVKQVGPYTFTTSRRPLPPMP